MSPAEADRRGRRAGEGGFTRDILKRYKILRLSSRGVKRRCDLADAEMIKYDHDMFHDKIEIASLRSQ